MQALFPWGLSNIDKAKQMTFLLGVTYIGKFAPISKTPTSCEKISWVAMGSLFQAFFDPKKECSDKTSHLWMKKCSFNIPYILFYQSLKNNLEKDTKQLSKQQTIANGALAGFGASLGSFCINACIQEASSQKTDTAIKTSLRVIKSFGYNGLRHEYYQVLEGVGLPGAILGIGMATLDYISKK